MKRNGRTSKTPHDGSAKIHSAAPPPPTTSCTGTGHTRKPPALLSKLAPPLCVVLDGGQGALSAIKACWPQAKIQRCLAHAQRRTPIYHQQTPNRARQSHLRTLTDLDRYRNQGTSSQHNFGKLYHDFLNEKALLPKEKNPDDTQWEYTHLRVRKAYKSLEHLTRKKWLFIFSDPPADAATPTTWASTTNSLEGGINAQLKILARLHRGHGGKRQRKMIKWWLHSA